MKPAFRFPNTQHDTDRGTPELLPPPGVVTEGAGRSGEGLGISLCAAGMPRWRLLGPGNVELSRKQLPAPTSVIWTRLWSLITSPLVHPVSRSVLMLPLPRPVPGTLPPRPHHRLSPHVSTQKPILGLPPNPLPTRQCPIQRSPKARSCPAHAWPPCGLWAETETTLPVAHSCKPRTTPVLGTESGSTDTSCPWNDCLLTKRGDIVISQWLQWRAEGDSKASFCQACVFSPTRHDLTPPKLGERLRAISSCGPRCRDGRVAHPRSPRAAQKDRRET